MTLAQPLHPLRPVLTLLALVLGLVAAGPAAAQYKWRDARGQMHISDQPPPRDIPDKDVLQRPGGARPAAAISSTQPVAASAPAPALRAAVDPELQQRRARAEQEAKARAQAEERQAAAQRAENCQRARQQLATLDTGMRLVRLNERGERVVLDDAARAQESAQARNVLASDCR